jgi:hypothetical protein
MPGQESVDITHDCFREVHLGSPTLEMSTVQIPDVCPLEHSRPWAYGFELFADLDQQLDRQDTGGHGSLIGILRKDIPAAEDEVF